MSNKKRPKNVHPKIANAIITSVEIPFLPPDIRNTFIRPDTIRLYIPKEEERDSEEEKEEEEALNKLREKYKKKRIKKVIRKIRNSVGGIRFTVIWENDEEETVHPEYLHDHPDWDIIEEFEHKVTRRHENSPAGQLDTYDVMELN